MTNMAYYRIRSRVSWDGGSHEFMQYISAPRGSSSDRHWCWNEAATQITREEYMAAKAMEGIA